MSIDEIVKKALQDGYLTPAMEVELGQMCDRVSELSMDDYVALESLMELLLAGRGTEVRCKEFVNVIEELILRESISQLASIRGTSNAIPDLGDVIAYALNRVPPLYATTKEGASYQRTRGKGEFGTLITQQVLEAISHIMSRSETLRTTQSSQA
ncbi:MAG: late competence development ComFB family protein [Leptolyngbyaceae bacterium]|nr:late competence development ComFB family protein [Leptolyngbyaceae bacterium]